MKAILEFNLPEEKEEFEIHNKAGDYKIVIDEWSSFLRSKIKHTEMSREESKIYESLKEEWYSLLNTYDV